MDELLAKLNQYDVVYEIIEHTKQIHSAQEGAEYFGIDIGQTAPTLIMKTDKGYYAVIICGDYGRVDLEAMKALLNVEQLRLAKPNEVEQVTGSKIGSVALINSGLPTIIDKQLFRYDYVYGGTGVPQTTLKLPPDAIVQLNEIVGYLRADS
ncbi:YbaK/EbsC family protein [Paenibacillus sp. PR3]|uniref:YbaK/EbsC family protein n=1 Tax=Paenibacillus terricola TaxID=2763503 RepID=A0ABR8N4L7_9BACL|nr:YbaK/EbsC family protein [Paenibacillus terricola]MBD3922155.1 YbaK/EbsC family protein [Paenibacillus terricola]